MEQEKRVKLITDDYNMKTSCFFLRKRHLITHELRFNHHLSSEEGRYRHKISLLSEHSTFWFMSADVTTVSDNEDDTEEDIERFKRGFKSMNSKRIFMSLKRM
jgi:hypothetical protein